MDTNVLVYAYDRTAKEKHQTAREILLDLWKTGNGVISTQVLQEFFVNVTRKIPNPMSPTMARTIVADFLKWTVVIVTGELILEAIDLQMKHRLTFWDSMVVSAAILENTQMLYSEDLQDGLVPCNTRF